MKLLFGLIHYDYINVDTLKDSIRERGPELQFNR